MRALELYGHGTLYGHLAMERRPGQTLQGNKTILTVVSHSRMTGDAQILSKACRNFP